MTDHPVLDIFKDRQGVKNIINVLMGFSDYYILGINNNGMLVGEVITSEVIDYDKMYSLHDSWGAIVIEVQPLPNSEVRLLFAFDANYLMGQNKK